MWVESTGQLTQISPSGSGIKSGDGVPFGSNLNNAATTISVSRNVRSAIGVAPSPSQFEQPLNSLMARSEAERVGAQFAALLLK